MYYSGRSWLGDYYEKDIDKYFKYSDSSYFYYNILYFAWKRDKADGIK